MFLLLLRVQSLLLRSSGNPAVTLSEGLFQMHTFRPKPGSSLGDAGQIHLRDNQYSMNFDF